MKKLTRNTDDRWIGGVCAGISDYTGLDVTLVRVVTAVLTVLGVGSLILGYLVAWVLIPKRRPHDTVWAQATDVPPTAHEPGPPSE